MVVERRLRRFNNFKRGDVFFIFERIRVSIAGVGIRRYVVASTFVGGSMTPSSMHAREQAAALRLVLLRCRFMSSMTSLSNRLLV